MNATIFHHHRKKCREGRIDEAFYHREAKRMNLDRRTFLKFASLGLLAVTAKPAIDLLTRPGVARALGLKGKETGRLAMAINLKSCTAESGCRDCVLACHSLHNVPDIGASKEEIKWIWETEYHRAFAENEIENTPLKGTSVLLLCNHCDNPPCVRVCPTQATWRRDDGIVMMDYHRCIGCRYCMAACPYGSRSFNWRDPRPHIKNINMNYPTRTRGVVEKCNFCEERLAAGELPACVEACKQGALTFGELKPGTELQRLLAENFALTRKAELGTRPQVSYIV
jgi:molybdopterin-containing oxidoreductase family iron-sulfur binding subunit